MVELEYALQGLQWDIVGLAEIRRNHEDYAETKEGHIFCHGAADNSQLGVGFLIHNKWKEQITDFKPISPRLALLSLKIDSYQLALLQIHVPTTEYADSEVEIFYDLVRQEMSLLDKNAEIILIGDFNASIGKAIKGEESVRGNSNYGKRNKRGGMLLNFAGSLHLKIVNSYFGNSEEEEKWTWLSPKNFKFEIDYFLARDIDMVQKFYIQKNCKFDSDHRMLVAELEIKKKKKRHNRLIQNNPFLKIKSSAEAYKDFLDNQLNNISQEFKDVQNYYQAIITCIKEATLRENNIAEDTKSKKISKKLTKETINLINRREELNRIVNKSEEQKNIHKIIRKETRRQIRKDVNNYEEEAIKQIIEETGSTKKLFKNLAMNKRSFIHNITHNNQVITNREEIAETFADYFENIYKSNYNHSEREIPTQHSAVEGEV